MQYFDFHCHLDSKQLDKTRDVLLYEMKTEQFGACTIGVDLDSSKKAVGLATACENVWCCIGQHPVDNRTEKFAISEYQKMIDTHSEQIVGIGECGLDYYWPSKDVESGKTTADELQAEKDRQKMLFRQNISLAIANDLPLMLHVRSSAGSTDAHVDALNILENYRGQASIVGVFHFFTEGVEMVQRIVKAGYYVSFSGVATFADLDDSIRAVPMNRILAETDSPYAAPVPQRGKTNNPMYIRHVYDKIADVKGLDPNEVRKQILQNAQTFLKISF